MSPRPPDREWGCSSPGLSCQRPRDTRTVRGRSWGGGLMQSCGGGRWERYLYLCKRRRSSLRTCGTPGQCGELQGNLCPCALSRIWYPVAYSCAQTASVSVFQLQKNGHLKQTERKDYLLVLRMHRQASECQSQKKSYIQASMAEMIAVYTIMIHPQRSA